MALHVVVVGAGVAGVTAATALAQAGHKVTVLEKSQFANEVGAALNLTPNGSRVLRQLGFDFERAGAVAMNEMQRIDGTTLDPLASSQPLRGDYYAIHRGDLHSELMRMAEKRVVVRLGAAVTDVHVDTGCIKLVDGTELTADVIVGADGVHSVVRRYLSTSTRNSNVSPAKIDWTPAPTIPVPAPETEPEYSGCSAYRFLLPTSLFHNNKQLLAPPPLGTMRLYIDPTDASRRRHLMWYACRNGSLQNFVAIHPIAYQELTKLDSDACKAHLLGEFGYCHPELRAVMDMADNVRLWPLFTMTPLPQWSSGRTILIGDAAHPMLPFSGQGANQAIEDAGALGFLLSRAVHPSDLPQILARFERVRVKRASRVQMMSGAVAGWELDVQDKVAPYCEDGVSVPTNIAERFAHDALFDVYKKCKEVMSS